MFEAGVLNGLTRISVEIGSSKSRRDDDFMDRVNHSYSTTFLMICTLVVLGRQFIGKPVSCWTPNEFTSGQVEYATLVCWVTSTYFVSPEQAVIPRDLGERRKHSIYYYQWVPFVLMFQAALFSVPCIVWRLLNWQSRIHLWTIMDLADKSNDLHELVEARANHLHFVVRHLEDALVMRHRRKRFLLSTSHGTRSRFHDAVNTPTSTSPTLVGDSPPISASVKGIPWYHVLPLTKSNRTRIPGPRPCSPQSSSYLVGLYLIIKALYVFNSTGQIFLTARYLGHNSLFYGVYLLIDQLTGREWDGTGNFPRVTYCDFDMRRMGSNMHRHTLQCVLPINMFNEKIFMLLWFWLAAVTCCNVNSFLGWCNRSAFQSNRLAFIKGLLIQHTNHFKAATSSPPPPPAQQNVRNSSTLTTTTTTSTPTPVTPQFTTPDEKQCVKNFTEHVLGQDGVFVLRLVSINAGRRVAIDILHQLWTRYLRVIGLSSGSRQQTQRPTGLSIPGVTNSNNNGQPPIPKRSNLIGQLGRGLISSQFPTSAATAAVTLRRRRGVGRRDRDEDEEEERRRRSHRRQSESSQAFSSISPPPALAHQSLLLDEDHELGSWAGGSVVESDGRETLLNDGLI